MKKRYIPLILVFSLLMTIITPSVSISAAIGGQPGKIVNTTTSETVVFDGRPHNSMVYAGEIKENGVTVLNYLYSSDVTCSAVVFDNLRKALPNPYSDMLPVITEDQDTVGLHETSTQTLNGIDLSTITNNWTNAYMLASQIYEGTFTDSVGENMYNVDAGFKAAVDADDAQRTASIDDPIPTNNRVISHIGTKTTDSVTFTVENGQLIETHNVNLIYLTEATTVIYTSINVITEDTPQVLKGDLDGNQVVDANDASVALELYKSQNATQEDIQIGDMDNNQLIDANDASLILEYYKTHQ